jgi:hypothetical protein
MKRLFPLLILVLLAGCAHTLTFQEFQAANPGTSYTDYNLYLQTEYTNAQERKARYAAALYGLSSGMAAQSNAALQQQTRPQTCTTRQYGNALQTDCF